jgi:hypothetical protein
MGLFGKKKISANEAGAMYLESLEQMLSKYWPQMAKKLSPMIQIPLERLSYR